MESVFITHVGLTWETRAPLLLRANDNPELGPPALAHLTAEEYLRYRYIPKELFNNYYKFAFIRNPWDRVVSFYKYFGYQDTYDFKYFIQNILIKKLWVEKYYFVRPQKEFIYNSIGEQCVNFIGRYENLIDDFNFVMKHLEIELLEIPHKNKAQGEIQQFNILSWKSWNNIFSRVFRKSYPVYPDYREYYDFEAIDIVCDLYGSDLQEFGYKFPSI